MTSLLLAALLWVTGQALATPAQVASSYGKLPLSFEINQGQTDRQVKFLARGQGYGLFLTSREAVLSLRAAPAQTAEDQTGNPAAGKGAKAEARAAVVRMRLAHANANPELSGLDPVPGKSNYFIGNDPGKWQREVTHYARVKYAGVYPGIDLVYYGNQQQLEYDFVLAPGVDPKRIRLVFEGVRRISLDQQGNLILATAGGDLVQHKPVVYQEAGGKRTALEGRYVLQGRNRAGFRVASYDARRPLVIDPVLSYSTYLGGSGADRGYGIAVDASGNAYVAGSTASSNFPTTAGAYQAVFGGGSNAFVTKLNVAGTALVYSTYLGGSGLDEAWSIAVDASGNAYVTGDTSSSNFPTTAGACQRVYGGGSFDGFMVKLNAAGSALVYSTYLGGSGSDYGIGMALDGSGNTYVTGYTASDNFPTTPGAVQTVHGGGGYDAFVAKLNSAGSALVYSTYLGGSDSDYGDSIALDGGGNAYVTGQTSSGNFPTTPGASQTVYGGGHDAFVAKLNSAGSALVYSTYLGGSGADYDNGIAVDGSGSAYVTGYTASSNFPTTAGAYQTAYGGGSDAFVTKLNAAGSARVYSTYLGGSGEDRGNSIVVDTGGNAYVTGQTSSSNFPTTAGAYQNGYGGGPFDAFVAKLNATGTALAYSTYLGGTNSDIGYHIAMDAGGNAYVTGVIAGDVFINATGIAYSGNFPTTAGAYQTVYGGGFFDAFAARFSGLGTATYTDVQAQGLWWNPQESGWGINFAHQGDIIFATWFTYDASGKPWWLIAVLSKNAAGVYAGPVSTVAGPLFNSVPFGPAPVETEIGTMTATFANATHATVAYTVNGTSQIKEITPQVFGPLPTCVWGQQPNLALATNYQDLWWNANESGWGVNFTHQGDIIFATWFTYDGQGKPWWLIAVLRKDAGNAYSGPVSTVSGPLFNSVPFGPPPVETEIGTATATFANGNAANFAYTVNGTAQNKAITRQVFVAPGTVCQ